jgi:hypothetical protein
MPSGTQISTGFSTLEVCWTESAALQHVGVEIDHIAGELRNLASVVGLAAAIAENLSPTLNPYGRGRLLPPKVSRVHFGSPLITSVELGREIAASVGAIAFLIYGLKRIWGLDLELKTHREEMRARFVEAKRRAGDAQSRIDTAEALATAEKLKEEIARIDNAQGWGDQASISADGVTRMWDGNQATWQIDDD